MSADKRLRELERRWLASGDWADAAVLCSALVRYKGKGSTRCPYCGFSLTLQDLQRELMRRMLGGRDASSTTTTVRIEPDTICASCGGSYLSNAREAAKNLAGRIVGLEPIQIGSRRTSAERCEWPPEGSPAPPCDLIAGHDGPHVPAEPVSNMGDWVPHPSFSPAGPCSHCDQAVPLNEDGRISAHEPRAGGITDTVCPGTGRAPMWVEPSETGG